jgi:chromosomal replication initiator protein
MMEDCATDMSAPQGCTDNKAVIGIFKEALKEKVGADRFRMWFHHVVDVALVSGEPATVASNIEDGYVRVESTSEANAVLISVRGQFALDRLRNNYLGELRGAACQSFGRRVDVLFTLHDSKAHQVDLPFGLGEETDVSEQTTRRTGQSKRNEGKTIGSCI